ncbi:MAG: cytochrome C assembly protein, partial [Ramlibacter sp.]
MILASASPASVVLTLAAAAAYAVPAAGAGRLSEQAARAALLIAWLLHAAVLGWGLLGDPPRFGFAPALSVTAWLVLTVYAVERQLFPQLQARWALAGLGAAAVLLALLYPGTPLHVTASPWLPLHWALGIASYGLFAAAVVHA